MKAEDRLEAAPRHPTLREASEVWAKIGLLSFGGPAGQIALMHKELVEERRWIAESRFLHALNFCMLLPGPEAQQLATYIGWLLHGTRGGIIAGVLFVLPGFVVIMALSALYAVFHEASWLASLFFGLKAAVLAIVVEAVIRVGRRALQNEVMVGIAVVAFVALFAFNVPFPIVVLLAGIVGFVGTRANPHIFAAGRQKAAAPDLPSVIGENYLEPMPSGMAGIGGRYWRWPLDRSAGSHSACPWGRQQFPCALGLLFPNGGRHLRGCLRGAGLCRPGGRAEFRVVATGGDGRWPGSRRDHTRTAGPGAELRWLPRCVSRSRGSAPMVAGLLGGAFTTWVTFVPCFLWIFLGAPYIERLRSNKALSGALSAITAAVVGVILNLAIWFGLHVLFGEVGTFRAGPVSIASPAWESINWAAVALSIVAVVCLFRLKIDILRTLAICGALGLLAMLIPT